MIAVASITADLNGAMRFSPRDLDMRTLLESRAGERRASRTATLDGGSSLYDTGFSDADRTYTIDVPARPEIAAFIEYMTRTYSLVLLASPDGNYVVCPQKFTMHEDRIAWTLLVTGLA